MLELATAVLFIGIPIAAVCWADRRYHGPMPHPGMPIGQPWTGRRPEIWSLDYACGCTRFRRGEPVYLPCNVHEARLGRWSA